MAFLYLSSNHATAYTATQKPAQGFGFDGGFLRVATLVCTTQYERILWQIPDSFTPTLTPTYGYARYVGVAGADCPVSSDFFELPTHRSQVLLHSVLPHHSPHHATYLGMMGYEVQIAPQTLAFLTLARQNWKSYFTPLHNGVV